ncbi:unnamed protein product [Oikopleura dioica]|uniref:Methyltransferase domain-containing protein n=1 Tax=Oikopleura dioica TaxID=34765 RepID=E4XSY4_OIKDI|nr:unnamed protein product [Oikopleura dioica]
MEDFLILKKFCDEYREFGNAHMVDFIHGDFTTRFLNPGELGESFRNSIDECKKMMEKKLVRIEDLKEELNSSHLILSPDSPKVKDMPEKVFNHQTDKKSYEISQLSHLIADVCQTTGTNHVIDVGAGKGYLSTFLSAEFGLEVTAIDCVKNNLEKTLERAKSLEKHFHHRSNQADEKMEKKSTKASFL